MVFKIITGESDWDDEISKLDKMDIYFTFNYCKAVEKIEKGKANLAIFENNIGKIVYPFILRRIDFDTNNNNQDFFDIVTPYGYGGPYIMGELINIKTFRKMFEIYCKEKNIVSEVIRFHPLMNNYLLMQDYIDLQYIRQTTAVNLVTDVDVIRSKYSSMTKRNIKKAQKTGVFCVAVEKNESNVKIFVDLYIETMNRNNALDFYYFEKEIISNMLKDTKFSTAHLLFAYFEGRVVSAVIVYLCNEIAHYHLGASKTEYLYLKSNNMLFDYMIIYSKNNNAEILHLGGGYSENDGLFSFKSSFSNNNHFQYFIGKKVLDLEAYEKLIMHFSDSYILSDSYFPAYRGIIAEKKIE